LKLFTLKYDNGSIILLDQTRLPENVEYLTLSTAEQVYHAIKEMTVRGAPAIGVCAAFGVCVAARECGGDAGKLEAMAARIRGARPTATNLSWAVDRMLGVLCRQGDMIKNLEREAQAIMDEDVAINRKIGENLLRLLPENGCIMTHCNAGALATAKYGTALSPVYVGLETGRRFKVYACETRPRLQGSKLTAFELREAGVDVTVICDNNAANILKEGNVDAVITGCDRVAANGDAANKIGTFSLSILCRYFGIPFYIAAPTPTIDFSCKSGDDIEIEYRDESEVTLGLGMRTAPEGVRALNPAFDVTPAKNITAIVTEKGVFAASEFKLWGRTHEEFRTRAWRRMRKGHSAHSVSEGSGRDGDKTAYNLGNIKRSARWSAVRRRT
jgi:methylthioribose-1-phosphate isomerase